MNQLFPIFLKANEINILIVGGGNVAAEKLHFLLKSSPKVNIALVAEQINEKVAQLLTDNPTIRVDQRPYQSSDTFRKQIVIVAADNDELNLQIRQEADEHGFLLNVADTPALCDFYLGGIVTKGDLKVAISTNGKSPIMARRLREFFEDALPDSLEKVLASTAVLRSQLKGTFDEKLKKLNDLTGELIAGNQDKSFRNN